jgi:hypothetical protein
MTDWSCPTCGHAHTGNSGCPLCAGDWEVWELRLSPLPLERNHQRIASWLSQLPQPAMFELLAEPDEGLRVRMILPPSKADGAISAWAAMTQQQTRWEKLDVSAFPKRTGKYLALQTKAHVPNLAILDEGSDPLLALGGLLLAAAKREQTESRLHIWLLEKDSTLQEKLRALSAYTYGTESGVGNDAPNPWGLRLVFAIKGNWTNIAKY